jgi:hypothetical protein
MRIPSQLVDLSPFGERARHLPFSFHQKTFLLKDFSRRRTPLEQKISGLKIPSAISGSHQKEDHAVGKNLGIEGHREKGLRKGF